MRVAGCDPDMPVKRAGETARDGGLAIDMGLPVILVNHAVAEINGMKLLAGHLQEKFPELPVHFIPQGCMFRLVGEE